MRYSQYNRALANLAKSAENRLYFRRNEWPSADAKRKVAKEIKWQCWLSHEESATLDALRSMYGGVSRYALTRLALLALIRNGDKETKETEYNGRKGRPARIEGDQNHAKSTGGFNGRNPR